MVKGLKEPKLRFSEYRGSGSWEEAKLGSLVGKQPERGRVSEFYVEIGDIDIRTKTYDINKEKDIVKGAKKAQEGTILVSTVRPNRGAVTELKESCYVSSAFAQLYIDKKHKRNIVFQNILTFKFFETMDRLSTGSTYPTVNKEDVLGYSIYLPKSEEEQTTIGNFFSLLDNKINLQSKKVQNLTLYKKGLLHAVMSGELRYKDSEGRDYPEWEEVKIEKVFDFIPTKSYTRVDLIENDSDINYVHYGDIHTKFNSILNLDFVQLPKVNNNLVCTDKSKYIYCKDGDLILADASEDYEGIGVGIELQNVKDNLVIAGLHTLLLRPISSIFVGGYLAYAIKSAEFRKQVKTKVVGTKVLSLTKATTKDLIIYIPIKEEQQKITNLFSTLDRKIEKEQQKLESLRLEKQAYMQQMFV